MTNRCATGEAWQAIMLSCVQGRMCDKLASKKGFECGSNSAYAYFVSFVFFCSFLVSFSYDHQMRAVRLTVESDVESIRCCHYGQL